MLQLASAASIIPSLSSSISYSSGTPSPSASRFVQLANTLTLPDKLLFTEQPALIADI